MTVRVEILANTTRFALARFCGAIFLSGLSPALSLAFDGEGVCVARPHSARASCALARRSKEERSSLCSVHGQDGNSNTTRMQKSKDLGRTDDLRQKTNPSSVMLSWV